MKAILSVLTDKIQIQTTAFRGDEESRGRCGWWKLNMAQTHSRAASSLQASTYRISSTPTKQLPRIVPQIAGSLWNCKDILSASQESTKSNSEASTIVHRVKTQISSLLQDRSIEGRWAAIVLTKAAIEAGGPEVLSKSNGWVRSLLAILKKPDPSTTRNLAIITLTRIFMLTWDYSNIVREITTPALPTFIASCLNNAEAKRCSASELRTVLEAFATLILRHPAIFRTYDAQIKSLLLKILASTSSDAGSNLHYTQSHSSAARRLFVLLHHCAPKQGAGEKWDETLRATVLAVHATCDRVFRSVNEGWITNAGIQTTASASALSAGQVEFDGEDAIGLRGWKSIFSGCERIVTLLGILQSHIETASAGAVNVRIGLLADLWTRLLNLTVPPNGKDDTFNINNQIPRDEREAMLSILPTIHVAALEFLHALLDRFGLLIISVMQGLLGLLTGVFDAEQASVEIRVSTYRTVKVVLQLMGPAMTKDDIADLAVIMRACCEDLLPTGEKMTGKSAVNVNGVSQKHQLSNGDHALQASKIQPSHPTVLSELSDSAEALLPVILTQIDSESMPKKARVQMERTAILTRNKEALVACVLNPMTKGAGGEYQSSLLPLLARECPNSADVEALLRPRMPPASSKPSHASANEGDDSSEAGNDAFAGATDNRVLDGDEPVYDENEPTAGLLNALGQSDSPALARGESEDLYSATPPPDLSAKHTRVESNVPITENATIKRTADEPADADVSAKRLRASPVAEVLAPGTSAAPSGPDLASTQSSMPVTVAIDNSKENSHAESSSQSVTLPAQPASFVVAPSAGGGVGIDSDDSDFEMPPLTMEPDTEPEDEDDGDEEE